ncbi:MAG: hypothetical protein P8N43_14370, partial [Alphaproteobacteria bacterium]|nr:hypothetical protein [Alphaproteobacteria bacterium]
PDAQLGNQFGASISVRDGLGVVGAPGTKLPGYAGVNPAQRYYVEPARAQEPQFTDWPFAGGIATVVPDGQGGWEIGAAIRAPIGGSVDVEQGFTAGNTYSFGFDVVLSGNTGLVSVPGLKVTEFKPKITFSTASGYYDQILPNSYKPKSKVGVVYSYEIDSVTGDWGLHQAIVPNRYGTEPSSQAYTATINGNFGHAMAAASNWLAIAAPGDLRGTFYFAPNRPVQLFEYLDAPPGDGRICAYNNYEYAWPRPEVVELTLEQVTGEFGGKSFCPGGGAYDSARPSSGCGDTIKARGNATWRLPPFNLFRMGQVTSWTPDPDDSTRGILDIYPLRTEGQFYAFPEADCTVDNFYCTVTAYDGIGLDPAVVATGVVTAVRTLKAPPDFPCWVSAGEAFDVGPELQPGEFNDRDAFGAALAMSEDALMLLVGAPYYPGFWQGTPTMLQGIVYMYRRDDTSQPFQLAMELVPDPDDRLNGLFGMTLAIEGSRIAVGARQDVCVPHDVGGGKYDCTNPDGTAAVGTVYIFEEETPGAGDWVYTGRVDPVDDDEWQLFGTEIALSGDHLFVGATGTDSASGAVQRFVYESGVGGQPASWNWVETWVSPEPQSSGNFGFQIGLADETVLVASPNTSAEIVNVAVPNATGEV